MSFIKQGNFFFRAIVLFFFISLSIVSRAQILDTAWFYFHKQPTISFGLDGRNSFLGVNHAAIRGIRAGYDFGGKVMLFAGFYFLSDEITEKRVVNPFTARQDTHIMVKDFFYFTETFEYVFYDVNRWKFSFPLQAGIGRGSLTTYDKNKINVLAKSKPVFIPLEFAVSGLYRVNKWFGLTGGMGYRFSLGPQPAGREFSGTIYTYGFMIEVEYLYNKLFPKGVKPQSGP